MSPSCTVKVRARGEPDSQVKTAFAGDDHECLSGSVADDGELQRGSDTGHGNRGGGGSDDSVVSRYRLQCGNGLGDHSHGDRDVLGDHLPTESVEGHLKCLVFSLRVAETRSDVRNSLLDHREAGIQPVSNRSQSGVEADNGLFIGRESAVEGRDLPGQRREARVQDVVGGDKLRARHLLRREAGVEGSRLSVQDTEIRSELGAHLLSHHETGVLGGDGLVDGGGGEVRLATGHERENDQNGQGPEGPDGRMAPILAVLAVLAIETGGAILPILGERRGDLGVVGRGVGDGINSSVGRHEDSPSGNLPRCDGHWLDRANLLDFRYLRHPDRTEDYIIFC